MPDDSEHDWLDELQQKSRILLGGYILEDEKGFDSRCYLPEGKEYEVACRRALATLLCHHSPPREILYLLARLIAPDDFADAAERTLAFKFRSPGRRRDHVRNSAIAHKVRDALEKEGSVNAAIASVAKELGDPGDSDLKKEESVRKIWQAYKPFRDAGVM